jgi:thioredoxin 1
MLDFVKSVLGKKQEESGSTAAPGARAQDAPGAEPVHVTDATFEDMVLGAPVPAMVDFWAPWCGPCRMVAPVVEALAREYDGRAVVAKINTDENQQLAGRLGIMGIPTVILFKDGQEVDRVVGFVPRKTLEERLLAVIEG